ncbi:terminase large subunit [Streptomyces sp. C10-9-1]|uniref:terminase large subunit n=1 Tax=Streptomyces sp. C10-9-1 TaxID=1859285 RepID=UPI002112035E|nr:terminase large subunit [Streptomyces sp. C10-9-1]MCQ6554803.1 terminase large subunit [Streptomyces sp. C10-9-1]
MPRAIVRAPGHDRSRSLGWLAVAWMEHFVVHGPGDVQGEPVRHGDEYTGFVVDCYAVDDDEGRLLYDSAFFSRPKGCDKSGLGARIGLFEAFGPARFDGWAEGGEVYRDPWGLGFEYVYEPGEPMGRPVKVPYLRIMATEEGQTGNVFDTIHFNLTDEASLLSQVPNVDVGLTRIILPDGGEIMPSTASSSSKDGGKETWVCFDETHLYNTPELRRMYSTVTRNLRKRKRGAQTWYLETTTMFAPGQDSVAERTYEEAEAIRDGRKKRGRSRLMYDHRWGECKNLKDEDELRAALVDAYGDAMEWMDLESLVDDFYDLRNDSADGRRYFLNSRTVASDAWMDPDAWALCRRAEEIAAGDLVTLGFDGSIRDDATALTACRVSDGHLMLLGCWEKPEGPEGDGWQVDRESVDASVARAFERFDVCGFYADPPHWQDYVDAWTRDHGDGLQVRATQARPLEWWTNRPTAMEHALDRFIEAVDDKALSHAESLDPDEASRLLRLGATLSRHVKNARRRPMGRNHLGIGKEHAKSPKKIDAAMSAVLAYECRADAVAAGITKRKKRSSKLIAF